MLHDKSIRSFAPWQTFLFASFLAMLFAIQAAPVQAKQQRNDRSRPMDTLLIKNAKVFDVEAGKVGAEAVDVLIANGKIVGIGRDLDQAGRIPAIDIGGKILMPGMIDLHSHLLLHPYNEASWNEQVLNESLELRTIRGTVAARKTLEAGFTTLRDLGTEGAGYADVALRDAIKQGIIPGPRVFAVTKAMVTTGGYGPMGFDPRWKMPVGAQVADGVAECRRVTREQIAAGADWIKIYADYRRRPGAKSTATFSQEELNAIVAEAKTAGIPVAAHAATDEGIRRSVEAGVQTIEHGYAASPETLELMNRRGVILCPTLTASESIAIYQGWDPQSGVDHPRVAQAKTLIRNAINAGVTIACGSDVGVFRHGDNYRELELMFAYGMRTDQVVRSTTILAANVLQQDDLGLVRPGFVADLIVVDADPISNLETLASPLVVIKDGRIAVNRLGETSINRGQSGQPMNTQVVPADRATQSNDSTQSGESMPESANQSGDPKVIAPRGGFVRTLQVTLDLDGGYTVFGQKMTRAQVGEQVKAKVAEGARRVRLVLPRGTDLSRVAEEQSWMREVGVESIEIKQQK